MNNLSRSSMSEKDINDQSSQYPLLVLSYDSRKGTVTPWSEKTKVNLGDIIKFKFEANNLHEIKDVRINKKSLGAVKEYNLKITDRIEYKVEVFFKLKEVKLFLKSNNLLWGSVTNSTTLSTGMTIPITATPNSPKYRFVRWADEFDNTISTNESIFTPVILSDTTYIAEFEEILHKVSVKSNLEGAGELSLSDSKIGQYGTVTAMLDKVNEGFIFSNWSVGNYNYGSSDTAIIKNITNDIEIIANFKKIEYKISGESYPKGLGVISISNSLPNHGDKVMASTTIPIGYMITKWIDDKGNIIGKGAGISFIAKRSMKIVANFERIRYKVTTSENIDEGGATRCSMSNPIEYNRKVEIVATPNKGYHFVNMTEGNNIVSLDPIYTINNLTSNRDIKSNWEINKYNINVENSLGRFGIINVSNYNPVFGEEVIIKAEKDVFGYEFDHWETVDKYKLILGKDPEYKFKCDSNVNIKAVYTEKLVNITTSVSPSDLNLKCKIKCNNDKFESLASLPNNCNIEVEAGSLNTIVNKDWMVSEYYVNGKLFKKGYTKLILTNITNDVNVLVKCIKRRYRVFANCDDNKGLVSVSLPGGEYGDSVKLSVEERYGYEFDKWVNNLTRTEISDRTPEIILNEYNLGKITSFNSHPILTFTALFKEKRKFNMSCTVSNSTHMGKVTISELRPYIGEEVTFTADPLPGYRFIGFVNDGTLVSSDPVYKVISDRDIKLVAEFEKTVSVISEVRPKGSGIVNSNNSILSRGETYSVEATPRKGYRFYGYLDEDGKILSKDNKYTIDSVEFDTKIIAEFRKVMKVNIEYDRNLGIVGITDDRPMNGESVTITAIPNEGHEFQGFYSSDGNLITNSQVYIISKVGKDMNINAKFV